MRRSRRFSAIEASRQLLGNTSSETSESDSDSSIEDPENNSNHEEIIQHNNLEWKFVNAGQDAYDSSTISHQNLE